MNISTALTDALDGWHFSTILGCDSAEAFFNEFMYSPDSDGLEESIEQIEAACSAKFEDAVEWRATNI